MSEEQSEEENGLVTTEDGWFDDETAEPEVILRLPRGSDPAPELAPRATQMEPGAVSADADTPDPGHHRRFGPPNGTKPLDPGTVSADADTPDPGQHCRFGPLSSAKPKRSMYEMPTLPTPGIAGRHRVPGHSRYPTGSCMKCRPCKPRGMAGRRRGPGHSW